MTKYKKKSTYYKNEENKIFEGDFEEIDDNEKKKVDFFKPYD